MKKNFLFILILFLNCQFHAEGDYKIESVIPGYDGDKKIYLLTLFLPYNPTTVAYTSDPTAKAKCSFWWPKGIFLFDQDYSGNGCDLLWIDSPGNELNIL